ncbi:hypothetical protein [Alteromonas gilva]|uniref:Uncharacterized protein n=1 Tax=Alteromonas gilva TaxID=2987522 RepID=A0ABT5KZE1_9ALTE|nr:hypothetical protein [Alteromonas gilva]MDC8829631.1 hypothetical protein [Alteromonas gilva]
MFWYSEYTGHGPGLRSAMLQLFSGAGRLFNKHVAALVDVVPMSRDVVTARDKSIIHALWHEE